MLRNPFAPVLLLALSACTAHAQQPAPARVTITADSLPIFTIEADALKPERELLRQRGYVSHVEATPDGQVSINVCRQYTTYLTTDKGNGGSW